QVVSNLFIGMCIKKGCEDHPLPIGWKNYLYTNLLLAMLRSGLPHKGISSLAATERTISGNVKAALVVIPDMAGTGCKQRFPYRFRIALRHKHGKLPEQAAFGAEDGRFPDTQSLGQFGVHAPRYIVQVGMDRV